MEKYWVLHLGGNFRVKVRTAHMSHYLNICRVSYYSCHQHHYYQSSFIISPLKDVYAKLLEKMLIGVGAVMTRPTTTEMAGRRAIYENDVWKEDMPSTNSILSTDFPDAATDPAKMLAADNGEVTFAHHNHPSVLADNVAIGHVWWSKHVQTQKQQQMTSSRAAGHDGSAAVLVTDDVGLARDITPAAFSLAYTEAPVGNHYLVSGTSRQMTGSDQRENCNTSVSTYLKNYTDSINLVESATDQRRLEEEKMEHSSLTARPLEDVRHASQLENTSTPAITDSDSDSDQVQHQYSTTRQSLDDTEHQMKTRSSSSSSSSSNDGVKWVSVGLSSARWTSSVPVVRWRDDEGRNGSRQSSLRNNDQHLVSFTLKQGNRKNQTPPWDWCCPVVSHFECVLFQCRLFLAAVCQHDVIRETGSDTRRVISPQEKHWATDNTQRKFDVQTSHYWDDCGQTDRQTDRHAHHSHYSANLLKCEFYCQKLNWQSASRSHSAIAGLLVTQTITAAWQTDVFIGLRTRLTDETVIGMRHHSSCCVGRAGKKKRYYAMRKHKCHALVGRRRCWCAVQDETDGGSDVNSSAPSRPNKPTYQALTAAAAAAAGTLVLSIFPHLGWVVARLSNLIQCKTELIYQSHH